MNKNHYLNILIDLNKNWKNEAKSMRKSRLESIDSEPLSHAGKSADSTTLPVDLHVLSSSETTIVRVILNIPQTGSAGRGSGGVS